MAASASAAHQLDLFPLHPEHLDHPDDQVSCFFEPDYDFGGGATLNGLLGTSAADDSSSSAAAAVEEEPLSPSPSTSVNYVGLARAALRGREKLVFCYSEAAARPGGEDGDGEEASSCGVDLWSGVPQALSLKLDYEEIMSAWSDKGPLYIDGEAPQVVPVFHHTHGPDSVFVDLVCIGNSSCSSSIMWRVPEDGGNMVEDQTAVGKAGNREARVMRYREKKQNRLFSKRIRYEVRKLNAEKRPRMKGRFVKRKDHA